MSDTDLPLFSWKPPPCRLLVFPMTSRVGRIRDVAAKLVDKETEKHRRYYRSQVTEAIQLNLSKLGLDRSEIETQIASFWLRVDQEARRRAYGVGMNPEELA